MKIVIEVTDQNNFNAGWLLYLLGEPEPDVEEAPDTHDGWSMAAQTLSLKPVRNVFLKQPDLGQPQYVVKVLADAPKAKEPVKVTVTADE